MIISCSRRTDIPAHYTSLFREWLNRGYFETINLYSHTVNRITISNVEIDGFVFWSKNYIPFTPVLLELKDKGFPVYLNYTVNDYRLPLEHVNADSAAIIENVRFLSTHFPIFWRYDPVYLSECTDSSYHVSHFQTLCEEIAPYSSRVIVNLLQPYPSVRRNLSLLPENFRPLNLPEYELLTLCRNLQETAASYGLLMYTCTPLLQDMLLMPQSHCIDKETMEKAVGKKINLSITPQYKGCGCYKSVDIGTYSACHNACVYCYASGRMGF